MQSSVFFGKYKSETVIIGGRGGGGGGENTIKSNISYIFCNKPFKVFLEGQMSIKINLLLCLQSKTYAVDVAACHFCTHGHLFLYSIYSLQV